MQLSTSSSGTNSSSYICMMSCLAGITRPLLTMSCCLCWQRQLRTQSAAMTSSMSRAARRLQLQLQEQQLPPPLMLQGLR
jgi:hypothetical protein